jgi:hypothetical protein
LSFEQLTRYLDNFNCRISQTGIILRNRPLPRGKYYLVDFSLPDYAYNNSRYAWADKYPFIVGRKNFSCPYRFNNDFHRVVADARRRGGLVHFFDTAGVFDRHTAIAGIGKFYFRTLLTQND